MKNKIIKVILFVFFITNYQLSFDKLRTLRRRTLSEVEVPITNYYLYAQHEGYSIPKEEKKDQEVSPKKRYQCPMHPQVISDKPGKCPICGMNLVEVTPEETVSEGLTPEVAVKIKETQGQVIGVKTESLAVRHLMQMIRTVAKIAYDPELYKAQTEFIQAYKTREKIDPNVSSEIKERLDALVVASAFKLKLQGLSEEQIEQLKTQRQSENALLFSDHYVWAYLTLYEYDLATVKIGDHVVLKTITYPAEEFSGSIIAIDPVLDVNTRSVRARVKIDDPQAKLKPNMYLDAFIHVDLGDKLALPQQAVLDTGMRKIVYLDLGKGKFMAQEVELGPQAIALVDGEEQKFFPVIKGLKENDVVVTKGNFLIDSQSQLTGGMSALWGGASEIKQEGESEIKTEHKH